MSGNLFGLDGDEYLQDDPEDVIQFKVDSYSPDLPPDFTIEEWDVGTNRRFFRDVDVYLENIIESTDGEPINEEWYESASKASQLPEVEAAFEAALELLASKISYRMADNIVASHQVTFVDGKCFYDGTEVTL